MKRAIALILAVVMLLTSTAITAFAENDCVIRVKDASGMPGNTLTVDITVENNPGIQGATLTVTWDAGLTLKEQAKNGAAFAVMNFTAPKKLASPYNLFWYAQDLEAENIKDGVIATLTFEVSAQAKDGDKLNISLSYVPGDITDSNKQVVSPQLKNGAVSVSTYLPGDSDGNGRLNANDLIDLSQYIADGCTTDPESYNVSVNPNAGDVDDSGRLNAQDLIMTSQYIADGCKTDPESYNVKLLPSHWKFPDPSHKHTMQATPRKEATCTEPGNIAYWYCTECEKYYSNEAGTATAQITLEATVIAPTGHTEVTIPATATTTEGKKCSTCGKVLVEPQPLQVNEHNIIYDIANGDPYIDGLLKAGKITNNNPKTFTETVAITLKNISVDGYRFLGWYDGAGSKAEQIKTIPVGTKEDVSLYGHWEKLVYNVNLSDSINGDTKLTYTVDEGTTLGKTPEWSGYVFTGWSDKSGKIVKSVPAGTTGNINLTANWTSERNKTIPVSKLGKPDILHDDDNGQILFAYEIGEIRNVPLYTIKEFLNVVAGGVTLTESITDSKSITESTARNIAETVSKATTDTSAWTLSDSWNKTTDESWDHAEEVGEDTMHAVEEYREQCVKEGQTPTYVLGSGNNTTYTTVNSGDSAVSAKTENDESSDNVSVPLTTETDKKWKTSEKLDTWANAVDTASKIADFVGAGITLATGGAAAPIAVAVKAGLAVVAGGIKIAKSVVQNKENHEGKEETPVENPEDTEETPVFTAAPQTATYFINTNSGYNKSTTTGHKDTTSQSLHSLISDTHHYGEAYSVGGEKSDSESHAESNTNTREYGSTVTYSDAVTKTVTRTYSNEGAKSGYYRIVCAGTAHVFAVVGYDIATSTFYTYTYTVMDDETKEFLDYSKDGTFCDYENGILPFEVPEFVLDYVDIMTRQSDGLAIDDETGTVVEYKPSDQAKDDVLVYIPTYASVTDAKGAKKAVKITGIADELFVNNEQVQCVILSCFNERIPKSAFENCTNLKYVATANQTSIGKKAFSGCTNLEEFTVSDTVEEIGENAFAGVDKITVEAKTWDVVSDVLGCGANNVTLTLPRKSYLSKDGETKTNPNVFDEGSSINEQQTSEQALKIPSSFKCFGIIGAKDYEYRNVQIESDAEKTNLYNLTIKNDGKIPVISRSANVLFNEIRLENTAICLNLDAEHTELSMFGTNRLISGNQRAAVVRSVNMDWFNPNSVGKLMLEGNLYVWGDLTGTRALSDYRTFTSGKEVPITTKTEYDSLLHSIKVTFDANGGACSVESIAATPGSAIGTLPIPTRDYYTFDGWYTAASGGTKITESSKISQDTTVYAHWMINSYTASWNSETGYTISVNRTSSPNGNAPTGNIASGTEVYYGDTLTVTYSASTGYTLGDCGSESITVTGNVTEEDIYASATANSYTYNIQYVSTNGTYLGSSSATRAYGTTDTISPNAAFNGYDTPASQSVKWDATEKTITFQYTPTTVPTTKTFSGNWVTNPKMDYVSNVLWQNRTANSVDIYVDWTDILRHGYNSYALHIAVGATGNSYVGMGGGLVVASGTWSKSSDKERCSNTWGTGWYTIPVNPTTTSVSINLTHWQGYDNGGRAEGTTQFTNNGNWVFPIPTY